MDHLETAQQELRRHIRQKNRRRWVPLGIRPGRIPVAGIDAHKVAARYLKLPKSKKTKKQ